MMPPENEAFAIVDGKVRQHLPFFARLGLEFGTVYVEPSDLTSPTLWFKLRRPSNSYGVSIAFSVIRGSRGGLFEAFIVRPDGVNLSINDYLHFHDLSAQKALFSCGGDVPDFGRYVDVFLTNLESLLAGELKPFFDGVKWESVPLDLEPYK
jgi:hypothetical protein